MEILLCRGGAQKIALQVRLRSGVTYSGKELLRYKKSLIIIWAAARMIQRNLSRNPAAHPKDITQKDTQEDLKKK
jgi:hypothetical protein